VTTQALTYPGVYLEETAPVVHQVLPATTNLTAFLGVLPQGPADQAVYVTSWNEFATLFGGIDESWEVTYAVWQFFQGGGLGAWIVRLTSPTPSAPVGPLKLVALSSASKSVALSSVTSTSVTVELYPQTSGGGTVTAVPVTVTALDAQTVAAAINGDSSLNTLLKATAADPTGTVAETTAAVDFTADLAGSATLGPVTVTAIAPGPMSSGLVVSMRPSGGPVSPSLDQADFSIGMPGEPPLEVFTGLPSSDPEVLAQAISHNSMFVTAKHANIPAWPTAPVVLGGGVNAGPTPPTGGLPTPAVAAHIALGCLTLTALTPGTAPNGWKATVTVDATNDTATYELTDSAGNILDEQATGLPADPVGLAAAITRNSTHVRASLGSQQLAGGAAAAWSPGMFMAAVLAALGEDPDPPASGAAVSPLDQIAPHVFNLMCIPDAAWLPGPSQSLVFTAAHKFCQERQAFLLVDPPPPVAAGPVPAGLGGGQPGLTIDSVGQPGNLQKLLGTWGSEVLGSNNFSGAVYYPWVQIADPGNNGLPRWVPPSGSVAGAYAASDQAVGVWKAPAGVTASLPGVLALADMTITDTVQGELNPFGVNCVRTFAGYPHVVWGARTLAGDDVYSSPFKYVSSRRLADFIEQSLVQSLQWAVFEPNGPDLWAAIVSQVMPFMTGLYAQGAFFGATAAQAYQVACDATTTTPTDVLAGLVNINVGFQPVLPAEFVVLNIQVGGLTAAAS
jgi:uncharacterized protein